MNRRQIRKSLRTNLEPGVRFYLGRARMRLRQLSNYPALMRGARVERPIFIVGAPRSGTHMLFLILRTSSRLEHWRPTEAHEVWEYDYHPAFRGWDSNVLDESDAEPQAIARIQRRFFLATGSGRRLLDKTPRNSLRVPFVDAVFPDARYIWLRRDGRDNVNSLINAWRSPRYRTYLLPQPHRIAGTDPRWWKFVLYPGWRDDSEGPLEVVCARQWSICNERLMDSAAEIGSERWIDVDHDALVANPEGEIERLLEWLQLPSEDGLRAAAAGARHSPVNIVTPPEKGKWKRENPTEIEAIEPLIRPTMDRISARAAGGVSTIGDRPP
jgi:Sulfotransferase family